MSIEGTNLSTHFRCTLVMEAGVEIMDQHYAIALVLPPF